nr:hypothetical protein [Acidithiobacillus ferrianus]
MPPHEIGLFVRSNTEIDRARAATEAAALPFRVLDDQVETAVGYTSLCTMHLAKGLEFRAVAVLACDDEVIPLQARIASVADKADLEEVYNTERHLLYVACTRARDALLVSGIEPGSEFLDDLMSKVGTHGKPDFKGRAIPLSRLGVPGMAERLDIIGGSAQLPKRVADATGGWLTRISH